MSRGTILVTPRSVTRNGHPALDALREAGFNVKFCEPGQTPTEADLLRLLPGCVGYLAGVEKVSAAVLRAATDLKVISRNGTGIDNVDLATARALNMVVCRAEGANARGVAELTMGLILSLARHIPQSDLAMKAGRWERTQGFELEGRTLGVVGCGRIGRLMTGFALAFGMRVAAFDAFPDPNYQPSAAFGYAPLADVIAQADVLTLHCPPTAGGAVIDAAAIDRMKPGALLINTARAELVDRAALGSALESGRVGGYGVDAYAVEPPGDDPFLRHPRVIATPHAGGLTGESIDRAIGVAVENLLRELKRSEPR
jgi:phosphoglycerate dehydrogenase-like enzyme